MAKIKPDDWTTKRVIITAGAAGIGREVAETFQSLGSKVWICDVDEARLAEAGAALPGIGTMRCDVSDPAQVDAFIDRAVAAMGGLDILINNAGIAGPAAAVEDVTTEDWTRVMAVNVNGQFYVARRAVPYLKKQGGGVIINMASVAGKFGFPLRSPYSTSKWAVIGLTRGLSIELGPFKIRVNAIAPGIVSGERITNVFTARAKTRGITYEEMEAKALASVSLKTMVDPEEIAAMILYLCGNTGRAITGQVLSICGGIEWIE